MCYHATKSAHTVFHLVGRIQKIDDIFSSLSSGKLSQLVASLLVTSAKYLFLLADIGFCLFTIDYDESDGEISETIRISKYPEGPGLRSFVNGGYREVETLLRLAAIRSVDPSEFSFSPGYL